ncbi:MAG: hypothetical protein RBR69_03920 [Candidatus Cloacimonadaceae bacterium]|nr:hypothetical protein [Candidatus Cloacimonadota bacterium]MDY0127259.1 hypothetical protein [Candidatus Cloacimonadaceae bacterium]
MRKICKCSVSLGLILLCLGCSFGHAQMTGSAFQYQLHSQLRHSLLDENPYAYEHDYLPQQEGLSHPLASFTIFRDSLIEAFLPGAAKQNFLSYRYGPLAADINVLAGFEADFRDETDYSFLYKGWRLSARIAENLRLSTHWYNGAFLGDLDAADDDPLIDGYSNRTKDQIQLDNLSGEIGYYHDLGTLAIGRGRFQIGNTISGSIILNDKVNDYGYFLVEGQIGAFRLSMLHASLKADSTYSIHDNEYIDVRNYPQKYIALHQLSFYPCENTELFAGETVVYGNRSLDLNYLLPNSFWRAVEHNLWDRDNVMIYMGINQIIPSDLLLYAQFALDEFSYSKFFTSWWGNKYAIQGGLSIPTDIARFSLEATAVRPFTYAHFLNHTMYSHDGRPLGYAQGSNVLDISLEANVPWRKYCEWNTQLSWRKRGSYGNNWQDNYHDIFAGMINDASAHWFEGDLSHEYQISSNVHILFLAHHKLLLGLDSLKQDDWQHHLFAGWQFDF